MSEGKTAEKLRGKPIALPSWWLELVNEHWKKLRDEGWSYKRLADALTDIAGRNLEGERFAWDRKTVERFLDDISPTQELVDAFCLFFPDVPAIAYYARSLEEARAFRSIADAFTQSGVANPEKAKRRQVLVDARAKIEQTVSDQTDALKSLNERRTKTAREPIRRRARGMAGGRPPTS